MAINQTKLLSGRAPVVDYANLTADRYQFLSLGQAEPSLGAGAENNVLTLSNSNTRVWSNTVTLATITTTGNITAGGNIAANNITVTGNVVGNVEGLVNGIDIRYLVFDFAYLQPNTYNNPIQYLLAKTGDVAFGTFTVPAPLNIDFGTF